MPEHSHTHGMYSVEIQMQNFGSESECADQWAMPLPKRANIFSETKDTREEKKAKSQVEIKESVLEI